MAAVGDENIGVHGVAAAAVAKVDDGRGWWSKGLGQVAVVAVVVVVVVVIVVVAEVVSKEGRNVDDVTTCISSSSASSSRIVVFIAVAVGGNLRIDPVLSARRRHCTSHAGSSRGVLRERCGRAGGRHQGQAGRCERGGRVPQLRQHRPGRSR